MKLKLRFAAVFMTLLVSALGAFLLLDREYGITGGHGRAVDALIARNIAARGGADTWRAVSSLQLSGQMDLGQGMYVPYTMEQKRPGKMCIEFVFDDETAIQCVAAKAGWKLLPFRGRTTPEPMNEQELLELSDAVEIDGLLFDSADRGHEVELLGHAPVDGRDALKLEVSLPGGAKRWVYLDAETALEIKVEATRTLRGKERLVETFYSNWQQTDGLLIPRRHDTRTEGDAETHFLTVDSVHVNLPLDDARFAMPSSMGASHAGSSSSP
ncbi:MAG: outer membrane lipoprotein-sorting protein [Gammaproteobacteria bacterium]|nr:outer membrane lipoprotein-sorting protein [Gammaproteobacteria bacterium]MDH5303784.1 outer membrane lipoprotein-sorting protein [Gammaproteobacteria bacterium]MDH5322192.1 outer membrane lipoprotein-sorting protein [Gammaproteobacteria bacterium]